MGMIACMMIPGEAQPHVIYLTKKQSLVSVTNRSWCGKEQPAGEGVYQLPDNAPICAACEDAIEQATESYAKLALGVEPEASSSR